MTVHKVYSIMEQSFYDLEGIGIKFVNTHRDPHDSCLGERGHIEFRVLGLFLVFESGNGCMEPWRCEVHDRIPAGLKQSNVGKTKGKTALNGLLKRIKGSHLSLGQ